MTEINLPKHMLYTVDVSGDNKQKSVEAQYEKSLEAAIFGNIESDIFGDESKNDVNNELNKSDEQDDDDDDKNDEAIKHLKNKSKRKPVWIDEDDTELATSAPINLTSEKRYKIIRVGDEEEISTSQIHDRLNKRFAKIVGTPKWANLDRIKESSNDSTKTKKKKLIIHNDDDNDSETLEIDDETKDYLDFAETGNSDFVTLSQVTNANIERPASGKISTIQFHPTIPSLMMAGCPRDFTIDLFQIDGEKNPRLTGVYVEKMKLLDASFGHSPHANELFLTTVHKMSSLDSQRFNLYTFDLNEEKLMTAPHPPKGVKDGTLTVSTSVKDLSLGGAGRLKSSNNAQWIGIVGKRGQIHLFSHSSKEYVTSVRLGGTASAGHDGVFIHQRDPALLSTVTTCIAFSNDGRQLWAHGGGGSTVNIWDVRKAATPLHCFIDERCIRGTALCLGDDPSCTTMAEPFVATGCSSGITNVYHLSECIQSTHPKPLNPGRTANKDKSSTSSSSSSCYCDWLRTPVTHLISSCFDGMPIAAVSSSGMSGAIRVFNPLTLNALSSFPPPRWRDPQKGKKNIITSMAFSNSTAVNFHMSDNQNTISQQVNRDNDTLIMNRFYLAVGNLNGRIPLFELTNRTRE